MGTYIAMWCMVWFIANWFFSENNEDYWRRTKDGTRRRWWVYKLAVPPIVATIAVVAMALMAATP